ncbi:MULTISPECIES: glycosyltransferase family 2 protein [Pseudomonas]|jgi:glycosyltransferase involved in cell wall biosynthesis|uniref:Glycosyltransferase family 2 protein n=2 Tax=Pseudomonas TaxID=286 RepID=A0A4Y9T9B4_PSEFL|nr:MULTISPECIES: glycosyltransferase family 2 protein [Pseudomonas]CRM93988.1 Glycosyl transferase family 2 [Pseudomonas sp. 22 E 5]MCX9151549.1 glycosyltransferase family 2 protein [Pseudomonas sp. TB1-B1]QXH69491.1 glycosyltransferase family 2 protein [Pseudomonas asgharzadehiana]TFW40993.1 glycosyltransferase family 2 protein [Pseudomonas fluorescens]TKJ61241.1 glycosyltransferase family 2 protein [Pseudomonas sp. CFBP13506]
MLQFNLADQLNCDSNPSGEQPNSDLDSRTGARTALPTVAILLCTYQGQRYLAEQLASFETQSHSNWSVWASDDGSKDDTRGILAAYQQKWPEGSLHVFSGPAEGFAANFVSLTCNDTIQADFYAYSDQDDIWEADKLARSVQWLQTLPADVPGLYCSRTRLVDADNHEIGFSPLFSKPPSFANALMQNIGGGNTMVFNNCARQLLREAGEHRPVVTHDWWAYMLVTGCGGQVFYDPEPTLRYRQHGCNLVGTNSGWMSRFKRIRMLFQGRFKQWGDSNIVILSALEHRLTPENRKILHRFMAARKMSLIPRLICLKRTGIYRQTLLGNIGLITAAVFGKI